MSNGNRTRSMLGSGRRRKAGLSANNIRPFSMLDFGYQREAQPTKPTIEMYAGTNRRNMLGIRRQREAGSTAIFKSRMLSMLDTCYQREVRLTSVGIRGPGGRELYAINIEGRGNRTIDIYAENRGRGMSSITYQRDAGSTINIHSTRFGMLDICCRREARPTSIPFPERNRLTIGLPRG